MSGVTSTKPYMVRAMHEWCVDNGFAPYLAVEVDEATRVPMAYVKDGEIVLNINYSATRDLVIGNDAVTFSARFNGKSMDLYIPMHAVRGIFSRESGQGMFFDPADDVPMNDLSQPESVADDGDPEPPPPKKPALRLIK